MSILSTIKNNPQWKAWALENTTESRASLLVALNEKTVQRTKTDKVGFRGIAEDYYGVDFTRTILNKFKAAMLQLQDALLDATFIALSSDGLNFASENTRNQITVLQQADVFTQDEADKLKAIGIWYIGTAKSVTGDDATEELVAGWCTNILREDWQIRIANAYNAAVNEVANMTDSEIASLSWSDVSAMFVTEPE